MSAITHTADAVEVAVIGAGLAGLTAAALLSRAGQRVHIFEKARTSGGRARTQQIAGGYAFNQGPHALYQGGAARRILDALSIPYSGHVPRTRGRLTRAGHTAPLRFPLQTGLLTPASLAGVVRLLRQLMQADVSRYAAVPLARWLDEQQAPRPVRQFIEMLVRINTYTHAPDLMSTSAAMAQLQTYFAGNVWYLDGGWQGLVDGLARAATDAGAVIHTRAKVAAIAGDAQRRVVHLSDGRSYEAAAVIIAADPGTAARLLPTAATLQKWAATAQPVRAATLDVALSGVPRPAHSVCFGLDQATYLSVHSDAAQLAPDGGAVVHVLHYLAPGASPDPQATRALLEAQLDDVQPGWRAALVHARFSPAMTVANAVVSAAGGGFAGRPAVQVAELGNVWLAGDWVGAEGQLADAALASAEQAARSVQAWLAQAIPATA